MNKTWLFIVIPAVAVVSFGGAFGTAWLTAPKPVVAEPNQAVADGATAKAKELGLDTPTPSAVGSKSDEREAQRAMTEEQLRTLVREVRDKIRLYEEKTKGLQEQESRLKDVGQALQDDFKKLEDLRVDAATMIANLKVQEEQLERTRVRIEQSEQQSLKTLAATYDKMDSDSAGKILVSMCKTMSSGPGGQVNHMEDAVKLLYYMNEKKKAAVLAAVMAVDPDLAGRMSLRLKQIVEK